MFIPLWAIIIAELVIGAWFIFTCCLLGAVHGYRSGLRKIAARHALWRYIQYLKSKGVWHAND